MDPLANRPALRPTTIITLPSSLHGYRLDDHTRRSQTLAVIVDRLPRVPSTAARSRIRASTVFIVHYGLRGALHLLLRPLVLLVFRVRGRVRRVALQCWLRLGRGRGAFLLLGLERGLVEPKREQQLLVLLNVFPADALMIADVHGEARYEIIENEGSRKRERKGENEAARCELVGAEKRARRCAARDAMCSESL
jgi:hypothetical protein